MEHAYELHELLSLANTLNHKRYCVLCEGANVYLLEQKIKHHMG